MRSALHLAAFAALAIGAAAVDVQHRRAGAKREDPVAGEQLQEPTRDGTPVSKVKVPSWPDKNAPEQEVYAWDAVGGDLGPTARYGNLHSYTEDLKSLVRELDDSEQQARDLRIKLAEKDGFLGRMMERERMLKADLEEHKTQLAAMVAHRQAVKARMDRLKLERQQAELDYNKHGMDYAQRHIATTINSVEGVSSALDQRIARLDSSVKEGLMRETEAMRRSLQPDVAAGDAKDEGALQAVAAAAANMPAPATFLQASAKEGAGLRGSDK